MTARLAIVSRLEFVSTARLQWVRLFAVAFALLVAGTAWSVGSAQELAGTDGFARTTVALVPLVLLLVPLFAILLAVAGQTSEAGFDAFVYTQPVSRVEVLVGRWLGQGAALGYALAVGFGAGGTIVALSAGLQDFPRFLLFGGATFLLALIFLAIGALVAAATGRRILSLAIGTFVWFFFALLFDALALSAAVWLTGRTGGRVLTWSVFGNPAGLVRVVSLSMAGTPHLLGAAGESWNRTLGGPIAAAVVAGIGLAVWTWLPLAAACVTIRRRDL
jgi:Cu-processing system permease protein